MQTKDITFNLGPKGVGATKEYENIRDRPEFKNYKSWQPDFKGGFDKGEFAVHKWLWNMFSSQNHGVIVDVGANDGVTQSHSLPFIEIGWKAVLIEPNPELFRIIESVYSHLPTVNSVNCAIHNDSEAIRELYVGNKLSLGHSTLRPPDTWYPEEGNFLQKDVIVKVPARSLTEVLKSINCSTEIDILHIDAEGLGIEVLQSLDFNIYSVKAISIDISPFEYDPLALPLLEFMKDNNFSYVFCEAQSVWVSNYYFEEVTDLEKK